MRENYKEIPLLQQREIEARVMAPLIRAFCEAFGKEKTYEVVRNAMAKIALETGRRDAEKYGKGLDSFRENCLPTWDAHGALKKEAKENTPECCAFDVTYCAYANLYKELGVSEIGALVSCCRDLPYIQGFDDSIEFSRSKTIMEGCDCCDFCYKVKK